MQLLKASTCKVLRADLAAHAPATTSVRSKGAVSSVLGCSLRKY